MIGSELFDKIEKIVLLLLIDDYIGLKEIILVLSNEEMVIVFCYFFILLFLINILEDVDLVYEINYKNNFN